MSRKPRQRAAPDLRRRAICLAIAACFPAAVSQANPVGPVVVRGTATIQASGSTLSVVNSHNAIINWQGFSIGAGELTRFIQPSALSAVLNRVTGGDPSAILGALQSNGRVFLLNPNGIVFGAGAQVDVAGLVASTLALSNEDFLAGRMRFTAVPGAGGIVNDGALRAAPGGGIYLLAPDVANTGLVTAPGGEIVLAAGRSVELVNPATPGLRVEIEAPAERAVNVGSLIADGGRAGIYAGLIEQRGLVQANTVVAGENGRIFLKANRDIVLGAGSVVTASGGPGGERSGGDVRLIAGEALVMQPGSAARVDGGPQGGNGGFLELSGRRLDLRGSYSGAARAPGFRSGTLLFDPTNADITSGACGVDACFDPTTAFVGFADFIVEASNDVRVLSSIANAGLNGGNPGGSLTLRAGNDVRVQAPIGSAGTRFDHALTLQAGRNVEVQASVYLGDRSLILAADAAIPSLAVVSDGVGDVNVKDAALLALDTLGSINVTGVGFGVGLPLSTLTTSVIAGRDIDINASGAVVVAAGRAVTLGSPTDASARLQAGRDLVVTANRIEVRGGTATLNAFTGGSAARADATVSAGRDMRLMAGTGGIDVRGGDATARASAGSRTASANAAVTAANAMTITVAGGGMNVQGGTVQSETRNNASADASATATVSTSTGPVSIAVSGGGLAVRGGASGSASADGGVGARATANASASILSGGDMTLTVSGGLQVLGGANSRIYASYAFYNLVRVLSRARISSTGMMRVTVTGGGLALSGGNAASGSMSDSGGGVAVLDARAELLSGANMRLDVAGGITVQGGATARASASSSSAAHRLTVDAGAKIFSGGDLQANITGGGLMVSGGTGAYASAGDSGTKVTTTLSRAEIGAAAMMSLIMPGALQVSAGANALASASGRGAATVNRVSVDASALISAGAALGIQAGSVMVTGGSGAVTRLRRMGDLGGTAVANAAVTAGGALTIVTPGAIQVRAGNSARAGVASGSAAGRYMAAVSAGAVLGGAGATLTAGSLTVTGGSQGALDGARLSGPGTRVATALTNASVLSSGDFSYVGGNVLVSGGVARTIGGGVGSAASATAQADAGFGITGAKALVIAGNLDVVGGSSFDDGLDATNGIAQARAILDPGAVTISTTGDVAFTGGIATGNGSAHAGLVASGPVSITIGGATGFTLTGGTGGPVGTNIVTGPNSPVQVTFTGGGQQVIVPDAARDAAFLQTFASAAPPAPPVAGPAAQPPDESVDRVLQSFVAAVTRSTEAESGGSSGDEEDRRRERALPVCR